jgi:hypothetical protein
MSTAAIQPRLTFEDILQREPFIAKLFKKIKSIRRTKDFCANDIWYGYSNGFNGIREQIAYLETKYGYAVHGMVTNKLFNALPDCRGNCRCSQLG